MPAGAKPGERRGGRKKGSLNKATLAKRAARQELVEKAAAEGLTPLEVMLKAMRMHVDRDEWVAAASVAKDAAPYLHPRLSAVEAKVQVSTIADALDALKKGKK